MKYREDFDGAPCSVPGCDHSAHDGPIYLHGACHPGAPTIAAYEDGELVLTCAVCDNHVTSIAVARSGAPPAGVETPYPPELVDAARTMFDMVEQSAVALTLLPPGDIDVKLALETGASILYDKPMLIVAIEGKQVSDHLRRAADVVVEVGSVESEEGQEAIRAGIFKLMLDYGLAPPLDESGGAEAS